jgi:tetratricopeptide (TPR) repeat protein
VVALSNSAEAEPAGTYPDATRLQPSGSQSMLERGARHEEAGRLAEAAAAYTQAVRLDASNGRALLALGRLRVRMSDDREAELVFSAATNVPDIAARAFAERAHLRKARGRDNEAFVDLENAVSLLPEETAWAEELGGWYVARRAWLPALSIYRRLTTELRGSQREKEMGLRVRALRILSGELDPITRGGAAEYSFVRRALARLGTR